jgi:hypothetical protein
MFFFYCQNFDPPIHQASLYMTILISLILCFISPKEYSCMLNLISLQAAILGTLLKKINLGGSVL